MSAAVVKRIQEPETDGGLKGTDIANLASVSKATVSRWKNGTATPGPEDELRLSDMRYVVERLGEYYTRGEIRRWLRSPHPQLDGARAFTRWPAGAERVLAGGDEPGAVLRSGEGVDRGRGRCG